MKTDLFDFELPQERIATKPASPRDSARMLVVKHGKAIDSHIINLPDFLQEGDVMVFNDTKVIPARLYGKRGAAAIEITLHKPINAHEWSAFAKPGKKLRVNDTIVFAEDFSAVVCAKRDDGQVGLKFSCDDLYGCLERYGSMPLPPYMKREADKNDNRNYQTIYAQREGAVAAPTAGLHFTERLFGLLEARKIKKVFVTLHVGAGTFLPVKAEDTSGHKMHSEHIEISDEAADTINRAKQAGRRIIAVGTTSLRALEAAADQNRHIRKFSGETDIFITPGYKFKIVDVLMTNFHLPRSTLFMLVSAFAGLDVMQRAYKHAVSTGYRFYSYGDGCLLIP